MATRRTRRVQRERPLPLHHPMCHAIGCRAVVQKTEVFCLPHQVMLPSDNRHRIERTFRPGKRQSLAFEDALDRARLAIAYFIRNGHKEPRDEPFKWDDDERSPPLADK